MEVSPDYLASLSHELQSLQETLGSAAEEHPNTFVSPLHFEGRAFAASIVPANLNESGRPQESLYEPDWNPPPQPPWPPVAPAYSSSARLINEEDTVAALRELEQRSERLGECGKLCGCGPTPHWRRGGATSRVPFSTESEKIR